MKLPKEQLLTENTPAPRTYSWDLPTFRGQGKEKTPKNNRRNWHGDMRKLGQHSDLKAK